MNPSTLAAACIAALLTGTASSQSEHKATDPPVQLTNTPFELSGIGMSFRLPLGATATTRRIANEAEAEIVGPDAAYRITISSRASSNTRLTGQQAAESILTSLAAAYGINDAGDPGRTIGTLARELRTLEPVAFSGGQAHRFFIQQPAGPGTDESVRGVAVVDLGQGRMLVWDAQAPADRATTLADTFDAMLGSVAFADPERRFADRGIAIAAGQRVLAEVSPEDLSAIVAAHGERWYRLHDPAAGATDREVGYRRVTAWLGPRTDLNASGPRSGEDSSLGLLVRIEARTLGPRPERGTRTTYDSRGTYWVSADLREEAWELTVAVRDADRVTTLGELGARDGDTELVVSTQSPSAPSQSTRHRIDGEGYLPAPMAILLPHLLASTRTAGDFGFYAYRADTSTITYRQDSLRHAEGAEGWKLTSRVSPESPELARYLDADGRLVKEQLPDGKVWEPIELSRLAELWRAAGLPMD
jgi:hypothetical protein